MRLPADGPALSASTGGVEGPQRQVEALERGLVGGELPAGPDRSPEPGVEGLHGVRRKDDSADFDLEGEDRHELRPGLLGVDTYLG